MSEPMKRGTRGEGDEVRACEPCSAATPARGDWGGGGWWGAEGCAGAGESSHTDSLDGTEVFRRGGGGAETKGGAAG